MEVDRFALKKQETKAAENNPYEDQEDMMEIDEGVATKNMASYDLVK